MMFEWFCLQETINEKAECLKVTGMYRIDGICRTGDLPNPLNHHRLSHVRNREAYCCHQLALSMSAPDLPHLMLYHSIRLDQILGVLLVTFLIYLTINAKKLNPVKNIILFCKLYHISTYV